MSDTMKYTPGPWEVSTGSPFLVHNGGLWVASAMGVRGDEGIANVRLMAAAPDLLEALVMVRDADEDCEADGLPTIPTAARRAIDAAISKAISQP